MDYVFYTDAPLQRLSRWVRILGYMCYHCPDLIVSQLVFPHDLDDQSVILTRQPKLVEKVQSLQWPGRIILIQYNHWCEQVRQIIRELGLPRPSLEFERCFVCGQKLETVAKKFIIDRVPVFVFETTDNFLQCGQCGRVYWQGTHSRRLSRQIDILFDDR